MLHNIIDFIVEIIEIDCRQAQTIYGYNKMSIAQKKEYWIEKELDLIEQERNNK